MKKLTTIVIGLSLIVLAGCKLETPEIHGVVLDAETKQPVPEAWVHAKISISAKTIPAGEVGELFSVDPPHTRSDGKGQFVIPSKEFKKASLPFGYGTRVYSFSVSAETIDDRIGELDLRDYEGKEAIQVVIYVKPWDRWLEEIKNDPRSDLSYVYGIYFLDKKKEGLNEEAYHSFLRSLYSYCFWGRFSEEVPIVKGGCDEWELNYAIVKNERFLERLEEPKNRHQRIYYTAALRHLGYFFRRNRDYEKALETFTKVLNFDKRRNMDLNLSEYENQIKELNQLIQNKNK